MDWRKEKSSGFLLTDPTDVQATPQRGERGGTLWVRGFIAAEPVTFIVAVGLVAAAAAESAVAFVVGGFAALVVTLYVDGGN